MGVENFRDGIFFMLISLSSERTHYYFVFNLNFIKHLFWFLTILTDDQHLDKQQSKLFAIVTDTPAAELYLHSLCIKYK